MDCNDSLKVKDGKKTSIEIMGNILSSSTPNAMEEETVDADTTDADRESPSNSKNSDSLTKDNDIEMYTKGLSMQDINLIIMGKPSTSAQPVEEPEVKHEEIAEELWLDETSKLKVDKNEDFEKIVQSLETAIVATEDYDMELNMSNASETKVFSPAVPNISDTDLMKDSKDDEISTMSDLLNSVEKLEAQPDKNILENDGIVADVLMAPEISEIEFESIESIDKADEIETGILQIETLSDINSTGIASVDEVTNDSPKLTESNFETHISILQTTDRFKDNPSNIDEYSEGSVKSNSDKVGSSDALAAKLDNCDESVEIIKKDETNYHKTDSVQSVDIDSMKTIDDFAIFANKSTVDVQPTDNYKRNFSDLIEDSCKELERFDAQLIDTSENDSTECKNSPTPPKKIKLVRPKLVTKHIIIDKADGTKLPDKQPIIEKVNHEVEIIKREREVDEPVEDEKMDADVAESQKPVKKLKLMRNYAKPKVVKNKEPIVEEVQMKVDESSSKIDDFVTEVETFDIFELPRRTERLSRIDTEDYSGCVNESAEPIYRNPEPPSNDMADKLEIEERLTPTIDNLISAADNQILEEPEIAMETQPKIADAHDKKTVDMIGDVKEIKERIVGSTELPVKKEKPASDVVIVDKLNADVERKISLVSYDTDDSSEDDVTHEEKESPKTVEGSPKDAPESPKIAKREPPIEVSDTVRAESSDVHPQSPVVQHETPIVQPKSPVVQQESPVVQPESPVVQPESPVVQPESPVGAPESPIVQPKSPVVQPEAPVVPQESPLVQPESPVIQPESPVVQPEQPVPPKPPAVQPESPVVPQESPLVQPESPVVQPELPVVQPEPPVVQPEPPVVQPEPPVVQPEPPVVQPESQKEVTAGLPVAVELDPPKGVAETESESPVVVEAPKELETVRLESPKDFELMISNVVGEVADWPESPSEVVEPDSTNVEPDSPNEVALIELESPNVVAVVETESPIVVEPESAVDEPDSSNEVAGTAGSKSPKEILVIEAESPAVVAESPKEGKIVKRESPKEVDEAEPPEEVVVEAESPKVVIQPESLIEASVVIPESQNEGEPESPTQLAVAEPDSPNEVAVVEPDSSNKVDVVKPESPNVTESPIQNVDTTKPVRLKVANAVADIVKSSPNKTKSKSPNAVESPKEVTDIKLTPSNETVADAVKQKPSKATNKLKSPGQVAKLESPNEPVKSEPPNKPVKSKPPSKLVQSVSPIEPVKSVSPIKPVKSVLPNESVKPMSPNKPVKPKTTNEKPLNSTKLRSDVKLGETVAEKCVRDRERQLSESRLMIEEINSDLTITEIEDKYDEVKPNQGVSDLSIEKIFPKSALRVDEPKLRRSIEKEVIAQPLTVMIDDDAIVEETVKTYELSGRSDDGIPKLVIKTVSHEQRSSPKITIKPIVKPPDVEGKKKEDSYPKVTIKPIKQDPLKITITKQKSDETHSILKIYKPDDPDYDLEDHMPKFTIKPIAKGDESSHSPKITIKSLKQASPKVNVKSVHSPVDKSSDAVHSPKLTIKPVINPDDNYPRVTIKPIVKPEEAQKPQTSRQSRTKPLSFDSGVTMESISVTHSPKSEPLLSPVKISMKQIEESLSPKLTIKPIMKTCEVIQSEDGTASPLKLTIKPIPKPEESYPSPKITIKPIIKPDEVQQIEDDKPERIILKIQKTSLSSPKERTRKEPEQKVDGDEKTEKLGKIKLKLLKEGGHAQIIGQSKMDHSITIKRTNSFLDSGISEKRTKTDRGGTEILHTSDISINIVEPNSKPIPKTISDEVTIVKLDKPVTTAPLSKSHPMPSSESKFKNMLLQIQNKPDITCTPHRPQYDSSNDDVRIIEVYDNSVPPPTRNDDDVIIINDTSNSSFNDIQIIKKINLDDSMSQTPKKRGRPRKNPLEPKPEIKGEDCIEILRPKRTCRVNVTKIPFAVKERKPRGGGRGRGSQRGRGGRTPPAEKPPKEPKTPRGKALKQAKLLAKQAAAELSREIIIDQITIEESNDAPLSESDKHEDTAMNETILNEPDIQMTIETVLKTPEKESDSLCKPPPPVMYEEETRMSADSSSRAQTPARQLAPPTLEGPEESQSSMQSTATTESIKNKKGRLEIADLDSAVTGVEQIAEYSWGGGGPYMLQEQIAQFLGVKSFKRKYPGLHRRPVDMQERDFIREKGLVSESMCDLGLTAVPSSEILDIMYSDFQDKYEEYRKYMREKQSKEITSKQKAISLATVQEKNKLDFKERAIRSAASWNNNFNKTRKDSRRCCMDLQTLTVNYPAGKMHSKLLVKKPVGHYPIALVPGQYTDYYKSYTSSELHYLPLGTVHYGPVLPNQQVYDMGQSDGSQSDSDSSSSSDSDSSDDSMSTVDDVPCKTFPSASNSAPATPKARV